MKLISFLSPSPPLHSLTSSLLYRTRSQSELFQKSHKPSSDNALSFATTESKSSIYARSRYSSIKQRC